MISHWGMRGKVALGSLFGQWCLRCLVPREPVVARPKEGSAPIIRRPLGTSRDQGSIFAGRSFGEAAPGL
jgi:hypothetical protein